MNPKLQFKKVFIAIITLVVSTCMFAQINVENFDYPESTLLIDQSIGFTVQGSDSPSISVLLFCLFLRSNVSSWCQLTAH